MRRSSAGIPALVVLLAACQDNPPNITLLQLERGGAIEFACLCEETDGSWSADRMESCDHRSDSVTGRTECATFALVLQTNRGEVAVVDLERRRLHDSDDRAPFTTFPQVGDFPSDLAVTEDGATVYVVHVGEPTMAILDASGLLGPTLPEPRFVSLPAPAQSISLMADGSRAFVTLPAIHALASIDLAADPPLIETLEVGPEPPDVDEEPEPSPDAATDPDVVEMDADDAADLTDVEEDGTTDVPADMPGEDAPVDLLPAFMPVRVEVVEDLDRIFISGFDASGGGGVLELDLGAILSGADAHEALVAVHLAGTPVGAFDVAVVLPIFSDEETTPEGPYLYAANRDEQLLHVVDLTTGEQIDTTGGNPLVTGGAIRTDGLVTDVLAVSFEDDDDETTADYELEPLVLRGDFVFITTSTGLVEVVDVYDRTCWYLLTDGNDENDPISCTPHAVRNIFDDEDSYPRWSDEPRLLDAEGESLTYVATGTESIPGTPVLAGKDYVRPYVDPDSEDRFSYGVTFYPDTREAPQMPDIRRPRTETWGMIWEGRVPWTTGVGGNLSEDGSELNDPGMPFCAMGVRGHGMGPYSGDVLVIEDGPEPLDADTDCSAFPADGGAAYRIVTATQNTLEIMPMEQFDVETDTWREPYPAPVEECFPFAVRYHVRTSGLWTVSGSDTGFLHATVIDEAGRCADELPPCADWDDESTCTLRSGRALMDTTFVNPYIRLRIEPNGADLPPLPAGDTSIMRPGLGFFLLSVRAFMPLATKVATLPHSLAYAEHYGTFFVSDRAWDGLLEFSPSTFTVIYEYN